MKFLDKIITEEGINCFPLYTSGSINSFGLVVGSTSLRSDTFNRTDNTTLGTPSDTGSNWIDNNSTGRISSNRAIGNPGLAASEYHPVALQSSYVNVYVQIIAVQQGSTSGIIYDYNDSLGAGLESYSGFLFGTDWANPTVVRVESGAVLYTIPIGITINDGDTVALQVSGPVVYIYVNSTLINSYPSINNSNTKQGIVLSNNSILENFSITLENQATASLNLYTEGAYVGRNSLMLYVGGSGLLCSSSLPLTCWNNSIVGSFSLFTIGEGTEPDAYPSSNILLLFVKAPYGASLPLYILGGSQPSANAELTLCTTGSIAVTGSLALSVPNTVDVKTKSLTLYTHGN